MKSYTLLLFCVLVISSLNAQTTVTLQCSQDAAIGFDDGVTPNGAGSNYGSATQNAAYCVPGIDPNGFNMNRALIDFNLSTLPANAVVVSASLNLYAYGPVGSLPGHTGANISLLQRITQTWQEYTATWNNQPSSTTQNQVVLAQSTSPTQNYLNINVTSLVQDMQNNPGFSFGFKLKLLGEINSNALIFASRDHANPALHPTLKVTYTLSCTQTISIAASASVICSGQPVVLSSSGAGNNVSWFASPTSTAILASGSSYTAFLSASSPSVYSFYAEPAVCPGTRVPVSVTVNPLPNLSISADHTVICQGQPANLTAAGALSYAWSNGQQGATMLVSPAINTTYTVNGIDGNGCYNTQQIQITVARCTGIDEAPNGQDAISIFPNPAAGMFGIKPADDNLFFDAVYLSDLQGRLVQQHELPLAQTAYNVDVSDIAPGVYFCTITNGHKTLAVKKVMVAGR